MDVQNNIYGKSVSIELTVADTNWHGLPTEVVVIRDITERKQNEEQRRAQQRQLMQADKLTSLGILVAGVAHEINNPNQSILANASILKRGCSDIRAILDDHFNVGDDALIGGLPYAEFSKDLGEFISDIEGCSKRIDRLVQRLKVFAGSARYSA